MASITVDRDAPRAAGAPLVAEAGTSRADRFAIEFVVTERQFTGEPVSAAFRRLDAELRAAEATLLGLMIYGALEARLEIERAMKETLGREDWPVTWIDAPSCSGLALAGVQAFAVRGRPVTRVRMGNRVVGSIFADGGARHCFLGGIGPNADGLQPAAQTQQTLGNLEWALGVADFKLGDVVRTWFYNEDILAWYGEFNRVRSAHYANVPWRTGSLPASTGIGARNPAGAALVMGAWAMQPIDPATSAREIGSPLQCPAPAYGSSFSRAMELCSGGMRRLFVSGTASIYPDGKSAWIGDMEMQVALTMEVVREILRSRQMDYCNVTRATAYLRDANDKHYFDRWCASHRLSDLPVVTLPAVVCRDDLLFEIELDAVASSSG